MLKNRYAAFIMEFSKIELELDSRALNKILNSTEEEYNLRLDFHYKTCENVGYSLHGLYIGRKNLKSTHQCLQRSP